MSAPLKNFTRFYNEHGIRSISHLVTLRKNELTEFAFPLNTTLHYAVRDSSTTGLESEDELLINAGKRVLTDYVLEYPQADVMGSPVKVTRNQPREIKAFLAENKRFKWVKQSNSWLSIPAVSYVINYNSIERTYKYRPRDGVGYFKTINFFKAVVSGVRKELKATLRNQFLYFDIPDTLPTLTRLMNAENALLRSTATGPDDIPLPRNLRNIFDSDGKMLLLHLWLWVGENPELSVFNGIPKDRLDSVNLFSTLDGRYAILNLGTFFKWVKSNDNPKGGMSHSRAQKALLRYFMTLQQLGTVSSDNILVDVDSLTEKNELNKKLGIDSDDGDYTTDVKNQREYVDKENIDPTLDVNIDANDYTKSGAVNVKARAKPKADDKPEPENESEDFIFSQMDLDLEQHSATGAQLEADRLADSEGVYREYEAKEPDLTRKIKDTANELAGLGLLSTPEVRRIMGLSERYKKIHSPFDESQTLDEYIQIDESKLGIDEFNPITKRDIKGVVDKSMLSYSVGNITRRYVDELMGKDIANAVLHFQNAGVAVTDMSIDRTDEYLGSYYTISAQLTPVTGKPSTVKFKIPVIEKDGSFVANGVRYFCKYQRNEAPIRKINFNSVSLNSYMSKLFVNRTARVRFDYGNWLANQIALLSIDIGSGLKDLHRGDVFDPTAQLPISYTALARKVISFTFRGLQYNFDYKKLETFFGKDVIKLVGKDTPFAKGVTEDGQLVVYCLTQTDQVYSFMPGIRSPRVEHGNFVKFLDLDINKAPIDFAEVSILGYDIPIGILLGYQIGLGNLLKTSKCKYRRAKRNDYDLESDEFAITFEDEVLIFNRSDYKACLIFNGFSRVKNQIRRVSVYSLDKKEGYTSLLRAMGVPNNHPKLYNHVFDVWVDHLTRGLLERMGEPTDLVLLMLSAVEKLCDDRFTDPNNMEGSIIRGYERLAGMIYASMYGALRQYVNTPLSKQAQVSINPNEVWFSFTQDETVATTEESNPIHSLKEREIMVYRGKGGRGADTMMAKHRQYTKDNIGIISEANVDNGQTGTVLYMTADPNITSLRGTTKQVENLAEVPRAKVQSTAMMVSAGSDRDDSKRVTFTSVMFTSTTFLHDAVPNRVLTGGERTIQYRVDDKWCAIAKKSGRVTAISKDLMEVAYDDGTVGAFAIGRSFGVWSGTIIPHETATMLKPGDVFSAEDVLTYNAYYFQPDTLNPRNVIFKRGIRGTIVQWEATDTLEDASTISVDFSKRLDTSMTEKRPVKIKADHDVEILVKVGDEVGSEDILCTLKPPTADGSSRYSDQGALAALDSLSTLTPKAGHPGVVESIEVIYTCDLERMSESLQEIVQQSDAKLYRRNKKLGIPIKEARVPPTYAIDGSDLGPDTVVIIFKITERVGAGVGDKLVIFNQLKTIISGVVNEPYVAEDGRVIDVTFSRQSVANRIVNSPDLIGTTNAVLSVVEKEMIEAYTGKNFEIKK